MRVRQPAVAGLFYPEDPIRLQVMIDGLLEAVAAPDIQPKALIVPHAGYIYSGAVAASAYGLLRPMAGHIRRVILLGPAHRVPLQGLATPDCDQFQTPLGTIAVDRELVRQAEAYPWVQSLAMAYQGEHSLEVQLPFLQSVLSGFTLLPLLTGAAAPEEVARVLDAVWGGDETAIIVSTDLSHFHPYEEAGKIDRATCDKILHFDTDLPGERACGCHALNGLLEIAAGKSLQIRQLNLKNSGDTAGDRGRVVGYGAFALYRDQRIAA